MRSLLLRDAIFPNLNDLDACAGGIYINCEVSVITHVGIQRYLRVEGRQQLESVGPFVLGTEGTQGKMRRRYSIL